MKPNIKAFRRNFSNKSYSKFYRPLVSARKRLPELKSEGNKPLSFTFDEQLDVLIYFHLQGFESGRHLLQALEEDKMAKELVAPEKGLKKSTFFEAINSRGLGNYSMSITTCVIKPKRYFRIIILHWVILLESMDP